MVARFAHRTLQPSCNLSRRLFVHDVVEYDAGKRSLAVVVHFARFHVDEFFDDRPANGFRFFGIFFGFRTLAQRFCHIGKNFHVQKIIRAVGQFAGSNLFVPFLGARGEAPVAKTEGKQISLIIIGTETVDIFFRRFVNFRVNGGIAAIALHKVRHDEVAGIPRGTEAPVIPPVRSGHDAGKLPVLPLAVLKFRNPFFVGRSDVVVHQRLFGGKLRVARPAVLFALRTVGRNAVIVADEGVFADLVNFIKGCVRRAEVPDFRERGVDTKTGQHGKGRFFRDADHFDVLEAVIGETRVPLDRIFVLESIFVGLDDVGMNISADLFFIDLAVFEFFAVAEGNFLSRFAGKIEFRKADEILPEVENPVTVRRGRDRNGRNAFGNFDFRHFHGKQRSRNRRCDAGTEEQIFGFGFPQPVEFLAGVVAFAVADRVVGNGAVVRHRPAFVRNDDGLAVNVQLQQQAGGIAPHGVHITPGIVHGLVVKTVAENDAKDVFALF